jgi:hypothetical protein
MAISTTMMVGQCVRTGRNGQLPPHLSVPTAAKLVASGGVGGPEEIDRLRTALRLYCQRDTLVIVEMHRALRRVADP